MRSELKSIVEYGLLHSGAPYFAHRRHRKDALILTLKSASDIRSPRIVKREQASAHRWHLEVRLDDPAQVDAELQAWLKKAIALAD